MAIWYHNPLIYQVYLKSFKDGNGDGVGDIPGLISKLDYFTDLKINTVLLSPFHPSPQKDNGFDITNYEKVDPCFGTMEDFELLIQKSKENDIHVLMNFVPNHTSDQHKWFQKSTLRIDPYTDYYVWLDPIDGPDGRSPPNNWMSVYGGSAWTWNEKRKQYYYHQFLSEQPDLNLRNSFVRYELKEILTFWLNKGVDGFRVDAASHLFEDEEFRDEPASEHQFPNQREYEALEHIYTKGQPESLDIIREWREVLNEYTDQTGEYKLLFVEVYEDWVNTMRYYGPACKPLADFPMNCSLIYAVHENTGSHDLFGAIVRWAKYKPDGKVPTWMLGSHDHPRLASRVGPFLLDVLHMIVLLLQGVPICYYGDELGMTNVPIKEEDIKDSLAFCSRLEDSRDPYRTPMQWSDEPNGGFTTGKPWLPLAEDCDTVNVQAQKECKNSHLQIFKKLMQLRQEPAILFGCQKYPKISENIFSIARILPDCTSYLVVVNMNRNASNVNFENVEYLPQTAYLEVSNQPDYDKNPSLKKDLHMMSLQPCEAIVLSFIPPGEQAEEVNICQAEKN